MSSQNNEQARTANTLLVAIGISLLLAIAFVNAASPVIDEMSAVVVVVETATNTPLPPTSTLPPTNSPVPTTTSTPLPTATIVPPTVTPEPATEVVVSAGGAVDMSFDPALASQGETLYASVCIACHGPDARGLPNLGKDLVESEFVHSQTDDELLTFVKTGRPLWDAANTTGIDMPPKGGNPALTDDDILAIIAYMRSLAAVSGAAPADSTTPTGSEAVAVNFDPALAAQGETLYASVCIACHGPDARGLPNLGKDLVESEFVHSQTDDELLTFVKTGRPLWDAANTTGIDMPPKGGNPALTDDDILAIIAYMRSLAA